MADEKDQKMEETKPKALTFPAEIEFTKSPSFDILGSKPKKGDKIKVMKPLYEECVTDGCIKKV